MYFSSFFFSFFYCLFKMCTDVDTQQLFGIFDFSLKLLFLSIWNFLFSFFIYIRDSEFSILHMIVIYGTCIWLTLVFSPWLGAWSDETTNSFRWTVNSRLKKIFWRIKKWQFLVNLKMCGSCFRFGRRVSIVEQKNAKHCKSLHL